MLDAYMRGGAKYSTVKGHRSAISKFHVGVQISRFAEDTELCPVYSLSRYYSKVKVPV